MQSSYPFLSVDYFILISDIQLLKNGDSLPDITNYNCPIIFIKTEILNDFIDSLLTIDKPYKLITGCNDDMAVPYIHYPINDTYIMERHNSLLNHSFLLKWYSKNICIHHPKLTVIPIGPKMQWHSSNFFGEDKIQLLERYNKYYLKPQELFLNSESKPNLLYMNMDASTTNDPFYKDHTGIRKNTISALLSKGFTLSQCKGNEEYIIELQTYKFCISPPGRGIDAHRTWEALMLGTIPICISSSLDSIYEKLPVLIVSDYSCITTEYLNQQYNIMKHKVYDFSVLYCDYWKQVIKEKGIYTAVILEPRKHKAMEFVLENFVDNLDERWSFIIYHGTENEEWLNEIINRNPCIFKNKERLTLKSLGVQNINWYEYCAKMANYEFVNSIPTEVFLVFQTDTLISKPYKDLIYDFMEYDYVGAPWVNEEVGNGGLSLRKKSKMLEIIKAIPYPYGISEDQYFCNSKLIKAPSFEKAKEFSMETVYSPKSFGVHAAWKYITGITEEQLPGYNTLVQLNQA